ncbi:MAG: hypothetical protein ACUVV5_11565 [Candidatus Aminicenantales bacterium]
MKRAWSSLFVFLGWAMAVVFSIQQPMPETESTVPELVRFHDVIYPIWHTAYPEKDYATLRQLASEVKNLAEKIFTAQLPGILRNKETKWKEGLEELKSAVQGYLAAAAGEDNEALLHAAELLHAKYELMVRIIRPVLKEVEAFHKVLYVVYHKYLPNKDYERIASVSEEMMSKAEAITQATLPPRLQAKANQFTAAAIQLFESVRALVEIAKSGEDSAIETAVENVHVCYQNLEKIFD